MPASTVPISQRCATSHHGRLARNTAIVPAFVAITALMLTLTATYVAPSSNDCASTPP